ncbi:zinc finger, CCHC-type containing protein [Tanacetum coccineum]
MHNMRKTIAELHAMLKLYENGILKKAETLAVLAIGRVRSRRTRRNREGQRGLKESRKLKHGALSLYMGNGMRVEVEAIRSFDLILPNNVFYLNAIPRDGIYEIDMHNLYLNVSSMFNVRNKRGKHALDSSYLWHCRIGHINKKRMDKLQRDEILQPTHD